MNKVKIGIIGSRFQADCIAHSVKMMPEEMEVVAVASPSPGNAEEFARRHGIPRAYTDYRELLRDPAVELVSITAPNRLHAQMTIDAAAAGKHVVCEKPLCVTLEEADAMIEACARANVLLLYAEELLCIRRSGSRRTIGPSRPASRATARGIPWPWSGCPTTAPPRP